jgi:hypothetical protein
MLRLIHNQTTVAGILVDDIDDGLPNKAVYRLGSTADPKAYERDGYANKPKQACYVPYSRTLNGFPAVAGYVNLNQTKRINFSAGTGKIAKLAQAGYITVVSLTAAQIVAPVITAAVHNTPGAGDITITGTTFLSVAPDVSTVTFAQGSAGTAANPASFTAAQILAGGGTFTATSIVIPAAMFTGQVPVALNKVTVQANEQNSNQFTIT